MKIVASCVGFLLFVASSHLFAETLSVEYASFYSHLNKIDTQETPALQFAFGFKNIDTKSLCTIKRVNVVTQKVTLDIDITNENRFLLRNEKALKQARAKVEIELLENANKCDMSVQLETKSDWLKTAYSKQELSNLLNQYEVFFDDMGGFLSFLMPGVTGLHFHFPASSTSTSLSDHTEQMNHLILSKETIDEGKTLSFPTPPYRITAVTK